MGFAFEKQRGMCLSEICFVSWRCVMGNIINFHLMTEFFLNLVIV